MMVMNGITARLFKVRGQSRGRDYTKCYNGKMHGFPWCGVEAYFYKKTVFIVNITVLQLC